MSERDIQESGSYLFLPWLRRGIAGQIARVDGDAATAQPRAKFQIGVSFNNGTLNADPVELSLFGPGDIAGFDPRAVIRTWPRPDVFENEPNLFPLIEFDQADLPWRYTPARANPTTNRLRPWLALIAIQDDDTELTSYQEATASRRLPVVTVKKTAVLPVLAESWAWAHVQVAGATAMSDSAMKDLLAREPQRALARILCPRRLRAKTTYRCFLVPAFERGRLAGLGQKCDDSVDAMTPAWQGSEADHQLPVYYTWRFQAGLSGDFEALALKLEPRTLPPTTGQRPIDVSHPGPNLGAAASQPLALESALQVPGSVSTPWDPAERDQWTHRLASLTNASSAVLTTGQGDRTVGPPLYGRWHAQRSALYDKLEAQSGTPDPNANTPAWFHELNSDPRLRVAAGMGASVVQKNREQLLAAAWQQVDKIRAYNAWLRQVQLAREVSTRIYERHIASAGMDSLMALTAPVHGLITPPASRDLDTGSTGSTVYSQLENSTIPQGVLSPPFRKVMRPGGPIRQKQQRAAAQTRSLDAPVSLLHQLNAQSGNDQPETELTLTSLSSRMTSEMRANPPASHSEMLSMLLKGSGSASAAPQPAAREIVGASRDLNLLAGSINLEELEGVVKTSLHPKNSIEKPALKRLQMSNRVAERKKDPLDPVMMAPEFPQPMFKALRELVPDGLLSGADQMPQNTITLFQSNQRFIEAFMAGLNHEMARALLYDRYPTDQRGTYFRRFWDSAGNDIQPIHQWGNTPLGQHHDPASTTTNPLVMLIRGELLHRYSHTVIYAVQASIDANGNKKLGTVERYPIFQGAIGEDIYFVAFDISAEEARGTAGNPGWFFIMQEQPSAPRFGLDVADAPAGASASGGTATLSTLSWGHFAADAAAYDQIQNLSITGNLPKLTDAPAALQWPSPGNPSAQPRASDIAYVTRRKPFRIAIHGSMMIPTL